MLIYNEKQFASIGENFHDLTTVFSKKLHMLNYLIVHVKENISQSFIQTIGN